MALSSAAAVQDPLSTATSPTTSNPSSKPVMKKAKIGRHLKFVGPLVLVIDTTRDYCWTVWFTVVLGLMNLFIGAVNMVAIVYAAKIGDIHAALCTVAYHFFSAEAILSLNYANGWSTPMRMRHRLFAHVFLQICGMICAVTGTVIILVSKGFKGEPHGITGIITAGLAGLTLLLGPCALFGKRNGKSRYLRILHISLGMPTFVVSSISLCLGFFTNEFKNWATSTVIYILIAFVTFYTLFMMGTVFVKCVSRI